MANAVLYNQGSHPAGALKSGTMSLNVSPSLEVGALKWRNGFENNNTWVIYSDTYSQGQATQGNALPTIWASTDFTDSGLVNLINVLPARAGQTPFTNVTAATSWLRGQGVYFLSNQNYPQIVTSGMTLMIDAGFPASFPNGTGTTWYDISGNDNIGTLNNGPTWVNSGTTSYLSFDGSNDYVTFSQVPSLTNQLTMECLFYMNSFVSGQDRLISNGDNYVLYFTSSSNLNFYMGNQGGDISTSGTFVGNWKHIVATYNGITKELYVDGVLKSSANATGNTPNGNILNLGAYQNDSSYTFNGRLNQVRIYNKALSQSEILQNYYKGPIVTSGLTMALDAGNLVSYGGTGTSWKDLTVNAFNGTLINGPTYSSNNGGCLIFDGSDDYVSLPTASLSSLGLTGQTPKTMEIWMTCDSTSSGFKFMFAMGSPNTGQAIFIGRNTGTLYYGGYADDLSVSNFYNDKLGIPLHLVLTYDGTTARGYYNGTQLVSGTKNWNMGSTYFRIGQQVNDFAEYFAGKVFAARIYNRALSATEVQQNFNAQRGRFGI